MLFIIKRSLLVLENYARRIKFIYKMLSYSSFKNISLAPGTPVNCEFLASGKPVNLDSFTVEKVAFFRTPVKYEMSVSGTPANQELPVPRTPSKRL
jgi:hypothetical protein